MVMDPRIAACGLATSERAGEAEKGGGGGRPKRGRNATTGLPYYLGTYSVLSAGLVP